MTIGGVITVAPQWQGKKGKTQNIILNWKRKAPWHSLAAVQSRECNPALQHPATQAADIITLQGQCLPSAAAIILSVLVYAIQKSIQIPRLKTLNPRKVFIKSRVANNKKTAVQSSHPFWHSIQHMGSELHNKTVNIRVDDLHAELPLD